MAWWEQAAAVFDPPRPRFATPGALAAELTPGTRSTPALELIDAELVAAHGTPDARLIVSLAPQEGKSTRVAQDFPLWALTRDPDLRVILASYGKELAVRNGRVIRRRVEAHEDVHGLRVAPDNGAVHDWTIAGHTGGVLSVGIGSGLTGRPADLMVIDDPIKDRREADSATYRQAVWDWWTDVASTRLAPGAPVVLILTRWHEDDLAGRLTAAEDGHLWRVVNIPAQADHRPEQGETDPLGRQPGEYLRSARGRTTEQWDAIRVRSGSRTWASLYQGRPSPQSGDLLRRDWWQWYEVPQHVERPDGTCWVPLAAGDEVCQSWDMAFKGTDSSDYVVGQVWLRRGVRAYLLDQVRGRMAFTDTLAAVKSLSARWPQAAAKYVEDKANGTAVINMLSRSVGGLVPVEPDGGKAARAQAVAPFVEAGNVFLPDPSLAAWSDGLADEAAAFPHGAHDDQVDALTQALNRLLLAPLLSQQAGWDDDDDDVYEQATTISAW